MNEVKKDTVLSVEDLTISFRTVNGMVRAVRGISFDLKRGETVAIVGESGSGKSVTIKAVMGILAGNAVVENGRIMFREKNLLDMKERDFFMIRGSRIGLIFQDPLSALNPIMKIGKQITEALKLNNRHLTKKELREKAVSLMESVGIPDAGQRIDQYPFQFSGGMRQRIVIAIALARDPEILICDEPTTALDVTVQAKILNLINEIKKERNLSVIFITHDMGVVAKMADRINVMYAGKIVEKGTAEEIFFEPAHPYTRALLASMPDLETSEKLMNIPGVPPDMLHPPKGDAFAARNRYAMKIDLQQEPPFFKLSETHYAATWTLHPNAPVLPMPEVLRARIERMKEAHHE